MGPLRVTLALACAAALALALGACGSAADGSGPSRTIVVNVPASGDGGGADASHRPLPMTAARRRALLRKDPDLRFVLLNVPHDPKLRYDASLRAVARSVVHERVGGQAVDIVYPREPNGRVILFEHGSDSSPNYDLNKTRSGQMIRALVRHGYTWAESTADFNNWGNFASLRADITLAKWLRQRGYRTIDIGGSSMGGLDATQLIPYVHPQAVFELFPVCDVDSVEHLFHVDIAHANAPAAKLSPVAMRDVRGLPILLTASAADTLVPRDKNAQVCAAEARAGGADVDDVETVGQHDDPSNWEPGRIIRFLDAASLRAGASEARRPRTAAAPQAAALHASLVESLGMLRGAQAATAP